jgi:acid stress chaperone HdeB
MPLHELRSISTRTLKHRTPPMTKLISACCIILMEAIFQPARAQVTLDLSKVTCDQWAGYKITNPQNIAYWLSGYYNGKRSNTVLDTQALAAQTQRLRDFCLVNPQLPVMQAVDKLLASDK